MIEKERKELLGNMTGSIAHELRGPIQNMQLGIQFIQRAFGRFERLLDDSLSLEDRKNILREIIEEISKYLGRMEPSNDRQKTVATTLETFARMEDIDSGQLDAKTISDDTFEKQPIDVFLIVRLSVEEAKNNFRRRGKHSVEIDLAQVETQLPAIHGQQQSLMQVLVNLLHNAYDAMKNSVERKIFINAYADRMKDVDTNNDQRVIHIGLKDTGPGIPDGMKEKIWEAGVTTKGKEEGSGFGLFWCRLIVEKIHKGKIWFETERGVGTTFHLMLPIHQGEVPE